MGLIVQLRVEMSAINHTPVPYGQGSIDQMEKPVSPDIVNETLQRYYDGQIQVDEVIKVIEREADKTAEAFDKLNRPQSPFASLFDNLLQALRRDSNGHE